MYTIAFWLSVAATIVPTLAQTSSLCNPTKNSSCPADPALAGSVYYDLTQGLPTDFTVSTGAAPTFNSSGAHFAVSKHGEAPTMSSTWYMMFGHYDVVMKAAPGVGMISSLVLLSDDLDEVDWEWLGADDSNVQSNYYGKGNTTVYDRELNLTNIGAQDEFHTYSIDWTSSQLTWAIDGTVLRTLTPATADYNQYPQTPMQLKLGSWAAGDPSEPAGTIAWAGGKIDYSLGPFVMTVESIKAIDYSTGKSYSYGDMSGSWQSIKSNGGEIQNNVSSNETASTASAATTTLRTSVAVTNSVPLTTATSVATTSGSSAATTTAGSASSQKSGNASSATTSATPNGASTLKASNVCGAMLGLLFAMAFLK